MAKKAKTRKDGLIEKVVDGHHFYGRTEREILKKIKDYQGTKESGISFTKLAEDWYNKHIDSVTPNSQKSYNAGYKKCTEWFRDTPWKTIRISDCNAYMNHLISRGYAFKTVSNAMLVLRLILKHGCVTYNVTENPMVLVKVPRTLPKTKRRCPEQANLEIVKAHSDTPAGLMLYFILYSGLRIGELLALRYEDIDFDAKTIFVHRSIYFESNVPHEKGPKSEAGTRTVPLLECLIDKIPHRKKGIVFPDLNGEWYTNKRIWTVMDNYRKETGANVTPHELRHAYATMCFEAGLMPKDVQHLLGHSDITTTMNIYTDWRDNRIVNAADKLNKVKF